MCQRTCTSSTVASNPPIFPPSAVETVKNANKKNKRPQTCRNSVGERVDDNDNVDDVDVVVVGDDDDDDDDDDHDDDFADDDVMLGC